MKKVLLIVLLAIFGAGGTFAFFNYKETGKVDISVIDNFINPSSSSFDGDNIENDDIWDEVKAEFENESNSDTQEEVRNPEEAEESREPAISAEEQKRIEAISRGEFVETEQASSTEADSEEYFTAGENDIVITETEQNEDTKEAQEVATTSTTTEEVEEIVLLTDTEKIELLLKSLLPEKDFAFISQIVEESDGQNGDLAHVEKSNEDGSKWKLGFDPVDFFTEEGDFKNTKELLTTLIHEYAHIIALNNKQIKHVPDSVEYVECEENEKIIDEGCAPSTSYLYKFMAEFWTEELREESYQADLNGDSEDFAFELFNERPNDFVSEYAATNAVEDFAESFAFFVTQQTTASVNTAEMKKNWFYKYPEFASLRSHMRKEYLKY